MPGLAWLVETRARLKCPLLSAQLHQLVLNSARERRDMEQRHVLLKQKVRPLGPWGMGLCLLQLPFDPLVPPGAQWGGARAKPKGGAWWAGPGRPSLQAGQQRI